MGLPIHVIEALVRAGYNVQRVSGTDEAFLVSREASNDAQATFSTGSQVILSGLDTQSATTPDEVIFLGTTKRDHDCDDMGMLAEERVRVLLGTRVASNFQRAIEEIRALRRSLSRKALQALPRLQAVSGHPRHKVQPRRRSAPQVVPWSAQLRSFSCR